MTSSSSSKAKKYKGVVRVNSIHGRMYTVIRTPMAFSLASYTMLSKSTPLHTQSTPIQQLWTFPQPDIVIYHPSEVWNELENGRMFLQVSSRGS